MHTSQAELIKALPADTTHFNLLLASEPQDAVNLRMRAGALVDQHAPNTACIST
jgi:hypothetical protein